MPPRAIPSEQGAAHAAALAARKMPRAAIDEAAEANDVEISVPVADAEFSNAAKTVLTRAIFCEMRRPNC